MLLSAKTKKCVDSFAWRVACSVLNSFDTIVYVNQYVLRAVKAEKEN